jgi:hypothetical protein
MKQDETLEEFKWVDLNAKKEKLFDSSSVYKAEYQIVLKRLLVEFTTGDKYEYQGIPEEVVDNFFNSVSPGKFINNEIKKGAYSFKKIPKKAKDEA